MGANSQYDSDLQMLVEKPRDANPAHLLFLCWLAERERLEHPVAGPPRRSPVPPLMTVRELLSVMG